MMRAAREADGGEAGKPLAANSISAIPPARGAASGYRGGEALASYSGVGFVLRAVPASCHAVCSARKIPFLSA